MIYSLKLLLSAIVIGICCYMAASFAGLPPPDPSPLEDHKACLQKDAKGNFEKEGSERYYYCRAELARKHIIKSSKFIETLTPAEIDFNKKMTALADDFTAKADAIHNAKNSAAQEAFSAWDDAQSKSAKLFNDRDHQTCLKSGLSPSSWGDPDTEKYYLCRAHLIEDRAAATAPSQKNTPAPHPRAALFFYDKATEARNALKVIDEKAHLKCVETAGEPGVLDDPKTKLYYACRTQLAETEMAPEIAALFRQKSEESEAAIAASEFCVARGIKKEDPLYPQCKEKAVKYKHCLSSINQKLAQIVQQDAIDCTEESKLKLPDQMATGQRRVYTPAQLTIARQKEVEICLRQKKFMHPQYKAGLKYECME